MRNTSILDSKINFYIGSIFVALFGFFAMSMTLHAAKLSNPLLDVVNSNTDQYAEVLKY